MLWQDTETNLSMTQVQEKLETIETICLYEDFCCSREGGRGTDILYITGGQNLGEVADIEYFLENYIVL